MTSYDDNKLLVYEGNKLSLKVKLPDNIQSPYHAVETSHGTYIVSHSRPQPGVSEVDGAGHVIRVYSDQQQLALPYHMTLTGSRVLVADFKNILILSLTAELKFESVVVDGLNQPWRLWLSEETGRLLVEGNRTVKVYNFYT